ncbi:hypothetical protein C453_12876 [Haloferax elongans ATCC BAA-1513]|uniref:Uncharacterized protein n=1 Tax=Haloferax elongans ATCC BAA-1513 TaxID=1230453 RepID=M0HIR5_HALEO|nr:hypothetical protein [Haloferax elongans]ELZ84440.1 hypothetical protein C453_12876 [Haloferax elongans ATCC BAA-1513]
MPSEWQPAGKGDRPQFPRIEEDEGEDPARFLAEPLEADYGDGASGMLALARIRGIESLSLLNAYRLVERELHGGERKTIKEALDEREQELSNEVQ